MLIFNTTVTASTTATGGKLIHTQPTTRQQPILSLTS